MLSSLALFFSGLFAGTCLYASVVSAPVRRLLEPDVALAVFRHSLARSQRMQPALHVPSLALTLAAFTVEPTPTRLLALVTLAPILPFTFGIMAPLNRALSAPALTGAGAAELLDRWERRHAVRMSLAVVGFAVLAAG